MVSHKQIKYDAVVKGITDKCAEIRADKDKKVDPKLALDENGAVRSPFETANR